jgi:hypothetical protein
LPIFTAWSKIFTAPWKVGTGLIIYEPRRNRRRRPGVGWPLLLLVLLAAGVWYVLAYPAQPAASSNPVAALAPPVATTPAPVPAPVPSPTEPPASQAPPESQPASTVRRADPKPEPEPVRLSEPLQLSELAIVTENGVRYIVGVVTDRAGAYYQYVSVKLALFDSSGTRLGEIFLSNGNTNQRLDPYGTWRFKAVLADPRAVSSELLELSGH